MALTKVNRGGLNTGISDSSDATFLTATSGEGVTLAGTLAVTGVHTIGTNAVITSEGGATTTNISQVAFKMYVNYGESASINDSVNGDKIWKKYWDQIPKIENAEFIDIRINSDVPDSGISYSYFDDVGLIEWDSIKSLSSNPIDIIYPNNYNYIQTYSSQIFEEEDQIT